MKTLEWIDLNYINATSDKNPLIDLKSAKYRLAMQLKKNKWYFPEIALHSDLRTLSSSDFIRLNTFNIDNIPQPSHPDVTQSYSNIGFKIMKIFNDHSKNNPHKVILYTSVDDKEYESGEKDFNNLILNKNIQPRAHSETKALLANQVNIIQNQLEKAKNDGLLPKDILIKFYIKNDAFPPCVKAYNSNDTTTTCHNYLPLFLKHIKDIYNINARIKVYNPTNIKKVFDETSKQFQNRNISESTKRYSNIQTDTQKYKDYIVSK